MLTENLNSTIISEEENIVEETGLLKIEEKKAYKIIKRCFDIVVSFVGLVVLFVPMLIVSLIIYIDSPGAAPIYVQRRVGKNGKIFKFYKFRSMIPDAEKCWILYLIKMRLWGLLLK